MEKHLLILILSIFGFVKVCAQNVTVTIDATQNKRKVSSYIYGKNESLDHTVQFYKDAGLRFARIGGGNNMSAYNWRKKITVHPDWYNNVYAEDWDAYARKINTDLPGIQTMFALQLLGRVASSTAHNFNDWDYNQSQWWTGVSQNLAGGGTVNSNGGSKALKDGDITLFSKEWSADSTVAIFNHWFDADGLALDKSKFVYWDMDNEPEIWSGTHDWAMPTQITASDFMERYFEYAKKARAVYPSIKICGPVTANEWQWYKWASETLYIDGKYCCWLEYFIKRCAEEEKSTGTRVLDVVDIHSYPESSNEDEKALQYHRLYFDTTYDYPSANGVHTINGIWDTSINKEYILKRINDWIEKYYGTNSGITCGLSEWAPQTTATNSSATAVAYASHLGTFANNGVEFFSVWSWQTGMWETLHPFSRYAKDYSVQSTSTIENAVSAYTTVNATADSMTVIIVNRDMSASRNVTVNLKNFAVADGDYTTLQLSSLPTTETFVSHTNNALKSGTVSVVSNALTITVPSLSVTAVILKTIPTGIERIANNSKQYTKLVIYNNAGQKISETQGAYDSSSLKDIDTSALSEGVYLVSLSNSKESTVQKILVRR